MGHLLRKKSVSKIENVWSRIALFKNWYKLVFPFNRMFTGIQKLTLRNGKSAFVRDVRSMDTNIVRDVLSGSGEYSLEKWVRLPPEAVVFDLGGNIGTFSIALHHLFPTVHITAYEPHPNNCKMFRINAPFATLIQKAATEKTGTVHFEDNANFVGLQVIQQGGIVIESQSLDDILKDILNVDLLKIDIEGSEYGLLNAASPHTFAKIRRIIIETHDVPGFDDLAWAETILATHGFRTSWIDPSGVIYGWKS
ncbi:MAG: FkbM family methyltransferase [Candidatus Kaiserbacteria bacterium]|nr:FkbM family methyltransferase [Candidatus Kaiserbacteria bacterium]